VGRIAVLLFSGGAVQKECKHIQRVSRDPLPMTRDFQIFHGTKLAQSGTKAE
jgi:hypothetical protein